MASRDRLAFLSMPAPSSYVPGLGRGASGFTTRSDIGPARETPSKETVEAAQARRGDLADYDSEVFQDPETEYGLFFGMEHGADDDEADEIFEKIEHEMGSRRKHHRRADFLETQAVQPKEPKIQAQFMDLKRALSSVTDKEWEKIPEVSNLTKRRKVKEKRSYAIPDSILVNDRNKLGLEASLSDEQQFIADDEPNIIGWAAARDKILTLKLDQVCVFLVGVLASASGSATLVNSRDYLTNLENAVVRTDAEIGDIQKARLLFGSMVKSNPRYAQGWIAAARIEEHAGNMAAARKLINAGCHECASREEIWLEAARLHNANDAKIVLANVVQHVQQSVQIWLKAAELEAGTDAKRRVLRKALESIPTSVRLWKEAVNLETSASEARLLLARAVEIIPSSVELWLALARLGPFEQAKTVLRAAGAANPTSLELRIAAAHLLESEGNGRHGTEALIDDTIATAVRRLRSRGVQCTREQWLAEAQRSDELGMSRTCGAIVKATISMDVEPEDRFSTWLADIEVAQSRGSITTARAITAYMLKVFPNRADVWEKAIEMSDASSSRDALLEQAVARCPTAEKIWLMWAKKKQSDGDVPSARQVLEQAFGANPNSERIWLAAVELEVHSSQINVARALLSQARDAVNTERLWMKSAVFERQQGNLIEALAITDAALSKFPAFAKLYMLQGQINDRLGRTSAARTSFTTGLKACPRDPKLWISASRLEERDNKSIKARSLLEKALVVLPADELIWAEAVHLEEHSGAATAATAVLARGLQACPTSGVLWSMMVWSGPRATRKSRAADAMIKSAEHPLVLCTMARLFWAERKIDDARDWFKRAAMEGADIGDIWAWWLNFEREHGTEDQRLWVISSCVSALPKHGRIWESIAKNDENALKSLEFILDLVSVRLNGDKAS
ncbi:PRP1 splicing factor, N-terminal-domain-containing protein [Mycena galopus ATCC 62051]|nr:PRP1 splicing factor, N-terminal-domain-containing protein [Mycena galopus ATCC 62051]